MSDPATAAKSVRANQAPQSISWRTVILMAGDAISFLVFVSVGRSNHGEVSGFSALLYVVGTALPFAAAWFVIAPLLGAFRRSATSTVGAMLRTTELTWLRVWPVAMVVRFIADRVQGVTLSRDFLAFCIVVLITNAIFLGVWRGAFALVSARLRQAR